MFGKRLRQCLLLHLLSFLLLHLLCFNSDLIFLDQQAKEYWSTALMACACSTAQNWLMWPERLTVRETCRQLKRREEHSSKPVWLSPIMCLLFAYLVTTGLANNYVYAAEGNCSRQDQCECVMRS